MLRVEKFYDFHDTKLETSTDKEDHHHLSVTDRKLLIVEENFLDHDS